MHNSGKNKQENPYFVTECDKIGEIAVQYGFTVIKTPKITAEDIIKSKQFKDFDYYDDAVEKIALTRWYIDGKFDYISQPFAIHYKKPLGGSLLKKKTNQEMYGFEIIGSNRPTSEALLLKLAIAILNDLGYKDIYVDINSIGDRESIGRFERELSNYYRKNAQNIPSKFRNEFRKNHYSILTDKTIGNENLRQEAPQTIGSLSDIGRLHFKEVLEYLETFGIDYKIKPNVLSNKLYATYTIFEIRKSKEPESTEEGELLAYCYRYNHLAKKIGWKREISSIGMTMLVKKNPKISKKIIVKNIKKPRFYLVQLGETAKLKVLNVVEMLRKEKISVYHSITKDKIAGQLNGAEYVKATHVLIMGQKEALENTIVVRDIISREQETVPIANLADFLKNIEKGKK